MITDRADAMSAVMGELVAGAHSARDAVVNTLDAVGRRTRAANAALVARVREQALAGAPARPDRSGEAAAERDTRFDPEEGWEPPPDSDRAGDHRQSRDQDEEEDYPQTWLR